MEREREEREREGEREREREREKEERKNDSSSPLARIHFIASTFDSVWEFSLFSAPARSVLASGSVDKKLPFFFSTLRSNELSCGPRESSFRGHVEKEGKKERPF